MNNILILLCAFSMIACSSHRGRELVERNPTSLPVEFSRRSLMKDLRHLYPHLAEEELLGKIDNSTDAFMFYRVLVPYYFYLTLKDSRLQKDFSDFWEYRGWLMGDVHPENFGFLLNKQGRAVFQMNDPDDAGHGVLFAEALRYFVGIELALRRMKIKKDNNDFLSSYIQGLSGEKKTSSHTLQKYFERAESRGRAPNKKLYNTESGQLFEIANRRRVVNSKQKNALKIWSENEFQDAKFRDAVYVDRDFGGSAFLRRYWVLLQFSKKFTDNTGLDSRWQIIELKEIAPSGVEIMRLPFEPEVPYRKRIDFTLKKIFQGEQPQFYRTSYFNGEAYYVRPRWHGISGLSPSDLEGEALVDLLNLQAWTLGDLQRTSLNAAKQRQWALLWSRLDSRRFNELVSKYSDYFEKMYISTKRN